MRWILPTGKQVWAFKAESAVQAPPLLVNNSLFVGSMRGYVLRHGRRGRRPALEGANRRKNPGLGQRGSRRDGPARILFGSYDFKLHCLDAENGSDQLAL